MTVVTLQADNWTTLHCTLLLSTERFAALCVVFTTSSRECSLAGEPIDPLFLLVLPC